MSTVLTFGCWDLLHVGHVNLLEHSKNLGTELVVGLPTDHVIQQDKGKYPIIPFNERLRMVQSLRCVDRVEVYYALGFLMTMDIVEPDILVVGEQWGDQRRHKDAERWITSNQKKIVKLPYYHGQSTSQIIQKIKEQR